MQVFNFLKSIIAEKDPCPSVEWTSPLRKRAGLQPYVPARGKSRYAPSTFLVNDTSGRLNRILSKQHPRQRWTASPTPTFHVHVTIAEGSADSSFGIPSTQVDKVGILKMGPRYNFESLFCSVADASTCDRLKHSRSSRMTAWPGAMCSSLPLYTTWRGYRSWH